jgi:hypothetical protein
VLKGGLSGILAYAVAPNIFPASLFGKNAPSNRLTVGLVGNGLICSSHIGTLLGRDDCRRPGRGGQPGGERQVHARIVPPAAGWHST